MFTSKYFANFLLLLCGGLCYAVPTSAAGDINAGKRVFQNCASCHQTGAHARHGFGPALHEFMGKKAGSSPGYAYSKAMRASQIVWDENNLRAFLRDPAAVVPGTKMRFWGYSDEQKISDLLAYLKSQQVKK